MNTQTIDAAKNSLQRVQKYLERLELAKGYHKKCIHAFINKDGDEIPLLVADLKALLQIVTTSTNTDAKDAAPHWDGVIKPADFIVDTFRRGGIGWVPKQDNCVRITHRPTGFFEEETAMRSVHANKAVAWQRLSDRLESLAAQGMDALNEWEDIRTLPTCDDLIWLYCQDSNTIDGPIAPEPNLEEYGWSHWAYANAPSTAWIDASQAAPQAAAQGMEQDAARYQALVKSGNFAPSPFDNGMWGLRVSSVPSTKVELDAAVDRVIAAQAKQGGV